MKVILRVFVILFAALSLLPGVASAISISQSLNQSSISYSDSAIFEITIEWDGPQQAYYFGRPLDPYFDRLKVSGFSSSIKSEEKAGIEVTSKKFRYVLLPTSSGSGKIDPITVSYTAMPDSIPGELVTEPMTITIAEAIPVVVDEGIPILYIYLIALVVICGGGFGLFKWNMSRKTVEPVRTPKEKFLLGLDTLKADAGSDFKKYQYGLCDILEEYLQSAFDLQIKEIPDDTIADEIGKTSLSEQQKDKISAWLLAARRDKFRPVESGPGETIRLESEIRELFNKL